MTTPVIDFHIHPLVYDQFYVDTALNWIKEMHSNKDWDQFYNDFSDPEHLCKFLQSNGIDYGVVMAEISPLVTGVCSNEYVLQYCQDQKMLIPFASINPNLTVNTGSELNLLIEKGFKGVKLYPTYQHCYPNDRRLYPLYSKAQDLQVPVMVHTGTSIFKGAKLKYGDPLYLDEVAVDFPDLSIILVHGGRGFWYERAFVLTRLHENVYMEIAGLPPQKLLVYFPELERISDKILFGTDWPGITDPAANIKVIKNLPLNNDTIQNILGGNALKLLKLCKVKVRDNRNLN